MLYKLALYADFKIVFPAVGTSNMVICNSQGGTNPVTQIIGRTTGGDVVACTINPGTGPTSATVTADFPTTVFWNGSNLTF